MSSRRDVYDDLKTRMPKVVESLKSMIAMGVPKVAILAKVKECTPVEIDERIWTAINWSIDCIVEDFTEITLQLLPGDTSLWTQDQIQAFQFALNRQYYTEKAKLN